VIKEYRGKIMEISRLQSNIEIAIIIEDPNGGRLIRIQGTRITTMGAGEDVINKGKARQI
jgi:hypothetical protein